MDLKDFIIDFSSLKIKIHFIKFWLFIDFADTKLQFGWILKSVLALQPALRDDLTRWDGLELGRPYGRAKTARKPYDKTEIFLFPITSGDDVIATDKTSKTSTAVWWRDIEKRE